MKHNKPQPLKRTHKVVIFTKRGTASAERVRKSDNGFLDWATDVLKQGNVSHIDVNRGRQNYKLALVGETLTRTEG